MRQEEINYFNEKIDWKFFNALRDRILKYEDMGTLKCEIKVGFNINTGYYDILTYKLDNITSSLNAVVKHLFEYNYSQLVYCIFINDEDCLTEFIESFNEQRYAYSLCRNGAFDAMYKKKQR